MKEQDLKKWFGNKDEGPSARLDVFSCVSAISGDKNELILNITPKHIQIGDDISTEVYIPVTALSTVDATTVLLHIEERVDRLIIYSDTLVDMNNLFYRDFESLTLKIAEKLKSTITFPIIEISCAFPSYETMVDVLNTLYNNIGDQNCEFLLHLDSTFVTDTKGETLTICEALSFGYLPQEIVRDVPYRIFTTFKRFSDFDILKHDLFDPQYTKYTAFE